VGIREVVHSWVKRGDASVTRPFAIADPGYSVAFRDVAAKRDGERPHRDGRRDRVDLQDLLAVTPSPYTSRMSSTHTLIAAAMTM
jgi:hypothetical protein